MQTKLDGDALPDSFITPRNVCQIPTTTCAPSSNSATDAVGASYGSLADLISNYLPNLPFSPAAGLVTGDGPADGADSEAATSIWPTFGLQGLRNLLHPHLSDGSQDGSSQTTDTFPVDAPRVQLGLERIKVTHVDTFWSAVSRAKYYGQLVAGEVDIDEGKPPPALFADLSNTVIMLGRSLTQVKSNPEPSLEHLENASNL